MLEPDAFDPTHALDGWRPPAPAPLQELDLAALLHPAPKQSLPLLEQAGPAGFDPTHLLDGWRPPAPAPLDLELKSMRRAAAVPDEAKRTRLKARGYEMLDVEDVELIEAPPPRLQQVVVKDWVEPVPVAPPLAETELAPPSDEGAMQAEEAVDVPLPDEEVWPLFVEEAQVLDAKAATGFDGPATELEPAPAGVGAVEMSPPEAQVELAASVEPESEPEPDSEVEPEQAPVAAQAPQARCEPEPLSPGAAQPPPAVEMPATEIEPAAAMDAEARTDAATPAPRFIDDIRLPSVPPPPVFEAPVLDFRAAPPPEPDPVSVVAGIELPAVTPPPVIVERPELDIAALTPRQPDHDPRLLAHWQAEAWTALARQIAGASEELLQTPEGLRVESRAPQWLCAIWPPQAQDATLGRWPELAALVAAQTMTDALQQLLAALPGEAPLWSTDLEADWDLVAELVLHQDAGLRPAQMRALRELAEGEREARLARIGAGYALQGGVARRLA